jgi:quinol monooxygenase YgiN
MESAVRTATISRAEVGCISVHFSFDVAEPNIAYTNEVWASQEDLDAHMAAPHAIPLRDLEACAP